MPHLADLRVVDFSRNVAGPLCTMLLADQGADVIKIERPPRGDEARYHGPPFVAGESPYFLSLNRNKRDIALDLKTSDGREIALELLRRADVAVCNFRPGVMDALGLGWDTLREQSPGLILCNITGYGKDGPLARFPAYDHVIQGMSGLMSITGTEESGPFRLGVSISDVLAGLFAVYGILTAVHGREESGLGEEVNVSLLAASVAALTFQAGQYFATGEPPLPRGNDHPMIAPYGTFKTADHFLNLAVGNNAMFRALCVALGLPELPDDPRFRDNPSRVEHRSDLRDRLEAQLARESTATWLERLNTSGVACGPVLRVDEALNHPQVHHLKMVETIEHPAAGLIALLGLPVKFDHDPGSIRSAPPILGQHSLEILRELGYADAEVASLLLREIVGAARASCQTSDHRMASSPASACQ